MWDDGWFSKQDRETQLFWIFLLTNQNTEPSGLYQLNRKVGQAYLSFDDALWTRCQQAVGDAKRAVFHEEWVLIPRFIEHQPTPNPSVWRRIMKQVQGTPKCLLDIWKEHNAHRVPTACQQDGDSLLYGDGDGDGDGDGEREREGGRARKSAPARTHSRSKRIENDDLEEAVQRSREDKA